MFNEPRVCPSRNLERETPLWPLIRGRKQEVTVSRDDTLCAGFAEFRSITLLAGNSLEATPLSMVVRRREGGGKQSGRRKGGPPRSLSVAAQPRKRTGTPRLKEPSDLLGQRELVGVFKAGLPFPSISSFHCCCCCLSTPARVLSSTFRFTRRILIRKQQPKPVRSTEPRKMAFTYHSIYTPIPTMRFSLLLPATVTSVTPRNGLPKIARRKVISFYLSIRWTLRDFVSSGKCLCWLCLIVYCTVL